MTEDHDSSDLARFKTQLVQGGDKFVKVTLIRSGPTAVQWLSDVTEHVEKLWRELLREHPGQESLGAKCISEFSESLNSVEHDLQSGVSIDGSPAVPPPVDVPKLRAVVDFYVEKHGKSDDAWKSFVGAIRAAHMAKKMRGEISASARTTSAGSGCSVLFVLGIGTISGALLHWL